MKCICVSCGNDLPISSILSDSVCSSCGGREHSLILTVPKEDPRPYNLESAFEQLLSHPHLKKWDCGFIENNWFKPFNKLTDNQKIWLEQVYSRYEDDLIL